MADSMNTPKTLIGVFASHDNETKNIALKKILETCANDSHLRELLSQFRLVFTGGTYERLFNGQRIHETRPGGQPYQLDADTQVFLKRECTIVKLPAAAQGGVTLLASLVTQRKVSILWPFLTPLTAHCYAPENQALLRLGDYWHAKRLMNTGSVIEWIKTEAEYDIPLNRQKLPLTIELADKDTRETKRLGNERGVVYLDTHSEAPPDFRACTLSGDWSKVTVALISHDDMKTRMAEFVLDYERELCKFKRVLATGTTGKLAEESAPSLAKAGKVHRYHSGPKGGDIEIATEILLGKCHVVIFFIDPLHPHPHTDDIRVVFGACMINDDVRMLSNEAQARYWMDRVVRAAPRRDAGNLKATSAAE
jgi:methylglyoxal synthase